MCTTVGTHAKEMSEQDGKSNSERSRPVQVVATLVNCGEHGEGEQEGTHGLHAHPLTRGQQRVDAIHGEVGPDERRRRECLGENYSEEGAEALTDAVAECPHRGDVAGDGEGDADGRVDVTAARVRQTPDYRRDTDPGGERNLHDTRMFSLPMRAQGTADENQDHRPDHFAQQIPIESSPLEFVKPKGANHPCRRWPNHLHALLRSPNEFRFSGWRRKYTAVVNARPCFPASSLIRATTDATDYVKPSNPSSILKQTTIRVRQIE